MVALDSFNLVYLNLLLYSEYKDIMHILLVGTECAYDRPNKRLYGSKSDFGSHLAAYTGTQE